MGGAWVTYPSKLLKVTKRWLSMASWVYSLLSAKMFANLDNDNKLISQLARRGKGV